MLLENIQMEIEERANKIFVKFFPKLKDAKNPGNEVLNLRFKITDKYRRNKIKEIFDELRKIDN